MNTKLCVFCLVGLSFSKLGLPQITTSDFAAPGGVWWHKKSRVTVEKPIRMNGPLVLESNQ